LILTIWGMIYWAWIKFFILELLILILLNLQLHRAAEKAVTLDVPVAALHADLVAIPEEGRTMS
jgi:hypothetical protein